jgi:hypothetical protein
MGSTKANLLLAATNEFPVKVACPKCFVENSQLKTFGDPVSALAGRPSFLPGIVS